MKGEARDVVGTLLASSRDPKDVMRTLDLHYGSMHTLAKRINAELYEMPRLDSKKISLIQFATRVRNAVASFKAHDLTGYLHNTELTCALGKKLPETLVFEYARYVSEKGKEGISELELMSDFLFLEAERTSKTVLFNMEMPSKNLDRKAAPPRLEYSRRRADVYAVNADPQDKDEREIESQRPGKCVICDTGVHEHENCRKLRRESPRRRRGIAASLGLCYGCLKLGHSARLCRSKDKCPKCNYCHHDMLPCYEGKKGVKDREPKHASYKTTAGQKSGRSGDKSSEA